MRLRTWLDCTRLIAQVAWAGVLVIAALEAAPRAGFADDSPHGQTVSAAPLAPSDSLTVATLTRQLAAMEASGGHRAAELAAVHESLAGHLPPESTATCEWHLRQALALRASGPPADDSIVAEDWISISQLDDSPGRMPENRAAIRRALALQARLWPGGHSRLARSLTLLGQAMDALGEPDSARQALQQAEDLYQRLHLLDDAERSATLTYMALLADGPDAASQALELRTEAARVARTSEGEQSGSAAEMLHNLGISLLDFGDYEGATAMFSQALPGVLKAYGPDDRSSLVVKQSLGVACAMAGDTARATRLLREVETDWRRHYSDPMWIVGTSLRYEAAVLMREHRDAEAVEYARRALAADEAGPRRYVRAIRDSRYVLIDALDAVGDSAGMAGLADSLALAAADPELEGGWMGASSLNWRAHAARGCGRREEAWSLALAADSMARAALRLDAQNLSERPAFKLAGDRAQFTEYAVELAEAGPPSRWPIAWDRVLRMRGLVRAELARRRLPLDLRADTALVAAHARWVRAQRELARALVARNEAPSDSVRREAAESARAAADAAELEFARALRVHGAVPPAAEVGLDAVRARLGKDEVLVSYCEFHTRDDAGRLVAYVTRGPRGEVIQVDLGDLDSLRAVIEPWKDLLAEPQPARGPASRRAELECRVAGAEVKRRVWDPISRWVRGASDIDLVPDGPTLDLPWQALPTSGGRYLVEDAPRIHVLGAERELVSEHRATPDRALLAVGAPDFEHVPASDVADQEAGGPGGVAAIGAPRHSPGAALRGDPDVCASAERPRFGALPGAAAELGDVERLWDAAPGHEARVLTGTAASEAAFKRMAPGHSVLHVATHGFVTGDTCATGEVPGTRGVGGLEPVGAPGGRRSVSAAEATAHRLVAPRPRGASPWMGRRVWLALAGANRAAAHASDENEGLLTAEEVATLDLSGTDWVVLSACHSALAPDWRNEGTADMRSAFQLAGARSVIASHWAVEDAATREWVAALYAARARGLTSASLAVAEADRAVLRARRRAGQSTHPFHWAAFTATGD